MTSLLKTGQIIFNNIDNFKIIEEDIKLKIDGDYTLVEIEYNILNIGEQTEVMYSFPIDISAYDIEDYEEILNREILDFKITSNNDNLKYSITVPKKSEKIDYIEIFDTDRTVKIDTARMFYNTALNFKKDELKSLKVQYKVKNQLLELVTTKSMLASHTERLFYYDVTPAKGWGNGIVEKFKLSIDFTDVINKEGKAILLPQNGIWNKNNYLVEYENFNLNEAKDIVLSYNIDDYLDAEYFNKYGISENHITSISASSTLEPEEKWNYEPENLIDHDYTSVWVEGKDDNAIGEYIEIEIKDFYIGYIGIINGHNFSEKTYNNNSRLLQVKLELELDPEGKFFRGGTNNKIEKIVKIRDLGWAKITKNNFVGKVQELYDFGDFPAATQKVRIYIDKVKNGDVYQDLCISEIIILGYPYERFK